MKTHCECGKRLPKRTTRTNSKQSRFYHRCHQCRSRQYTERHPLRIAWLNIKKSAKRRGKGFSLSYERFKEVAIQAGYIPGSNRHAGGLSIDRIRCGDGYTNDNIRVLTLSENSAREFRDDWEPAKTRPDKVDCPF